MIDVDNLILQLNDEKTRNDYKKLNEILLTLISNNISLKEIDNKSSYLTIYKIISYLLNYDKNNEMILNKITEYYDSLQINQNKCLIIADSHIGRLASGEYDDPRTFHINERTLHNAYNHVIGSGINNVIHLGDLLEGFSDSSITKLSTIEKQFEYLINFYPRIKNLKTYLLYGNHDYNLIYFNNVHPKFYKHCYGTELIGVNSSYINFCGYRIKLKHESDVSKFYDNISLPYTFQLAGHSHLYRLEDEGKTLRVPNISTLIRNGENQGFLEMINEENEFVFKYFDVDCNEVSKNELVLSKNLYKANTIQE